MTDTHDSMLTNRVLTNLGLVLFVFARLALYVPSCRTCLIVSVLAFFFYTNADLIARLLRETTAACLFFSIYIFVSPLLFLSISYIRCEHEIITQQVYMSLSVLSTDRQVLLIGTVQFKMKDPEGPIPPCPLSASIITCLKCANDPRHQRPVSVFIRCPNEKLKPTEKDQTIKPPPVSAPPRPSVPTPSFYY